MTYWQQPWGRFEAGGHDVRLQVLDPATAFAIEPEIIERVRPELLMTIAAPEAMLDGIGLAAASQHRGPRKLAEALLDPEASPKAASAGLRVLARVFSGLIASTPEDGAWVARIFERVIFDRIELERENGPPRHASTWRQWGKLGLGPAARWTILVAQLAQTFGPLWTRSPYSPSSREPKDYGVPLPPAPLAVQWASQLASQGYAAGSDEVLRVWTPERVAEPVEIAAHAAEQHHRASEAARAEGAASR